VEATVRTLAGIPHADRVVLILQTAATGATVFLGATEKIVTIVVMVSVRIVILTVTSVVISAEDVVLIVPIAISVLLSMVIVARVVSVLAASIAILVIRAVSLAIVVMVSVRIVVLTVTSVVISAEDVTSVTPSVRAHRVRAMNTPLPMVTNLRFPQAFPLKNLIKMRCVHSLRFLESTAISSPATL